MNLEAVDGWLFTALGDECCVKSNGLEQISGHEFSYELLGVFTMWLNHFVSLTLSPHLEKQKTTLTFEGFQGN